MSGFWLSYNYRHSTDSQLVLNKSGKNKQYFDLNSNQNANVVVRDIQVNPISGFKPATTL